MTYLCEAPMRSLQFKVDENPSTGYRWEVVEQHNINLHDHYVPTRFTDLDGNPLVGGGGHHFYFVHITNTADYKLVLEHRRPFNHADVIDRMSFMSQSMSQLKEDDHVT